MRPEYLFAGLLALFGTVFALGMPPCQTPDEPSHFFRAYRVSEGKLTLHKRTDYAGTAVPVSIARIPEAFQELPFHPERHTSFAAVLALRSLPLERDERCYRQLPGSAYYSFVPYVPQAVAMAVARAVGAGPLEIFYAGRLGNLLLAVVLVFWTVRLTPVFPLVFGLVALLPITVHQFASHNPDASTMGVAFLLTAVLFRLALGGDTVASRWLVGGFVALAGWLTLCKFPYGVLTLLVLAVPTRRLGRRCQLVRNGVLAGVLVLSALLMQLKDNVPDRLSNNADVSISKQTEEIRARPFRYLNVMLATLAEHSGDYIFNLGLLGWLDTRVNPLAMQVFVVFLVIVALGDRTETLWPSVRLKLTGLAAAGLCVAVILTSCYVCGCLLKAKIIVGPQPRYFVPLLPLLLLPLYNALVQVRADRRVLLTLSGVIPTGVLMVAVANFTRRYYLPAGAQLRWSPASLAIAAAIILTGLWWVRKRLEEQWPEESGEAARPRVQSWRVSSDAAAERVAARPLP